MITKKKLIMHNLWLEKKVKELKSDLLGEINTKEYYKNLYNELLNKKKKNLQQSLQ